MIQSAEQIANEVLDREYLIQEIQQEIQQENRQILLEDPAFMGTLNPAKRRLEFYNW